MSRGDPIEVYAVGHFREGEVVAVKPGELPGDFVATKHKLLETYEGATLGMVTEVKGASRVTVAFRVTLSPTAMPSKLYIP